MNTAEVLCEAAHLIDCGAHLSITMAIDAAGSGEMHNDSCPVCAAFDAVKVVAPLGETGSVDGNIITLLTAASVLTSYEASP